MNWMGHPDLDFRNPRPVDGTDNEPCLDCLVAGGSRDHGTHSVLYPDQLPRRWRVRYDTRYERIAAGTVLELLDAQRRDCRHLDSNNSADGVFLFKVVDSDILGGFYLISGSAAPGATWRELIPDYLEPVSTDATPA